MRYYKRAIKNSFQVVIHLLLCQITIVLHGLSFLALRVHSFSRFKDLVTRTNGLVSILAILILHVPVWFRNFSIREHPRFVRKDDRRVDLLASLCDIYDTSEEELRKTIEKANGSIVEILKKKPSCNIREVSNYFSLSKFAEPSFLLGSFGCRRFDLFRGFDGRIIVAFKFCFFKEGLYDAMHDKCELDERVFINEMKIAYLEQEVCLAVL